nr:hypothetical protein [Tanacetum cinerariifolium]
MSYLRPFGCHVTILNTIDQLGKFDGKSDLGFLVGYLLNSKAFKVYNLETKRVEENLHVKFLENKSNVVGKGHAWMFDLDYLTNSMNYEPVLVENQANKFVGPKEANNRAGTQANDDQGANSEELDLHDEHFVLPIWSAYSTTIKSSRDKIEKHTDFKTCEKPVSQVEQIFQEELEKLKRQEKEANDAARKETTHDNQDAHTNSINLFNAVSTPVSTAGPSRAFNDGEPSYPNDPSMPHLEDKYASPSKGIFTDSSYDDEGGTRSKVNKKSKARALVSYVLKQQRTNHKDFQHCLFACFLSQIEPKNISQALEDESWVDVMQEELLQFQIQKVWILVDFPYGKKAIGTKWVYKNKKDERRVVVRNKARLVAQGQRQEKGIDYDDVFALVARIEAIRIFLAFASYMGFIVYQMDVKSAFLYGTIDEEVYVTQPHSFVDPKFLNKVYMVVKALYGLHQAPRAWYATLSTFLEKNDIIFGSTKKSWCDESEELMKNSVKTASTPIETQNPLVKDEEAANVDVHLYRFQVTSKTSHLQAVKRIFRKSITRGCQFLDRRLISLQCKKQTIVATYTTEAEYVAAPHCCGQVLWIHNQLLDYAFNIMNTKIYIDNESTICIVKNLAFYSKAKHIEIQHHFIRDAYEKKLIQVLKIHIDDNVVDLLTKAFDVSSKELPSPKQTALSKDTSNSLIVDSLLKTIWLSMHHVIAMKHWLFQSKRLLRVVVTEDVIRHDLCLDDADGVECLPNEEIFTELARMGYKKPPPKLTFYKAFFSTQWKFLIHTLVQCMSAKRTAWNEFSRSMTSAAICLATEEEDEVQVPNAPTPPSPTTAPSPLPQEPISTPPQAQPALASSPPQEQPTTTFESSMSILNTLMETCATLSQKVAHLEQDKIAQALEIIKLKKRVKKLEKQRRSKSLGLKRLRKGRKGDDNVAIKDASDAVPTVFDDKEVTMTMAQTLIKMKAKKARLLDEQMAKRLHDKEVEQAAAREKRNNKVQTLFKPDKDEEPAKKRVAEETLLQESFRKLKVVEVLGSHSTQDTPTDDPKKMSEKDVKNMLKIVPVSEFEVEALQVKYPLIDWEIHSEGSRLHQVSSTRRHDIFILIENDYPLSDGIMILMLSTKLQVDEDSEMARDIVMNIFMEANKPKIKSLDTSSK